MSLNVSTWVCHSGVLRGGGDGLGTRIGFALAISSPFGRRCCSPWCLEILLDRPQGYLRAAQILGEKRTTLVPRSKGACGRARGDGCFGLRFQTVGADMMQRREKKGPSRVPVYIPLGSSKMKKQGVFCVRSHVQGPRIFFVHDISVHDAQFALLRRLGSHVAGFSVPRRALVATIGQPSEQMSQANAVFSVCPIRTL